MKRAGRTFACGLPLPSYSDHVVIFGSLRYLDILVKEFNLTRKQGELSDEMAYGLGAMGVSSVFTKPVEISTLLEWIAAADELAKAA